MSEVSVFESTPILPSKYIA